MAWYSSTGYTTPTGATAIIGNNLYVATGTGITKTDLTTGTITDSNWATGFNAIGGIITYGNIIYVSDSGDNSISTVDLSGNVTAFFNSNLVAGFNMINPKGLVIESGGDEPYLYVAASGSNIQQISITNPTGVYFDTWASDALINNPVGLCIVNGFMYVQCLYSVAKINMATQAISTIHTNAYVLYGIASYGTSLYVGIDGNFVQKLSFTGTVINDNVYDPAIVDVLHVDEVMINGQYLYATDASSGVVGRFLLTPDPVVCFKDGTLILTDKGYMPIEELRKGDLVKTLLHGYKPIYMIGKKEIYHPATGRGKDQLYIGTQAEFPWLKQDLIVTGSHCILVDEFKAGEQEKTIEVLGKIYATDRKYRLPACVDSRFAVYKPEGNYTVYHLALEHDNRLMNYGIYANGLLVETCSKRCIEEYGQMEIV